MNSLKISIILVAIAIIIEGKNIDTRLSSVDNFFGETFSIPAVKVRFLKGNLGADKGVFDVTITPNTFFDGMYTTIDSSNSKVTMYKVMGHVEITAEDNRTMNLHDLIFKILSFKFDISYVTFQCDYNYTQKGMHLLNVSINHRPYYTYKVGQHIVNEEFARHMPPYRRSKDILNQVIPAIESRIKNVLTAVSPKKLRNSFYPAIGKQGIVELNRSASMHKMDEQIQKMKLFLNFDPYKIENINIPVSKRSTKIEGKFENISVLEFRHHFPRINFRHDVLNYRAEMNLSFDEITVSGQYKIMDDLIRNKMQNLSNMVKMTFENVIIASEYLISNNRVTVKRMEVINNDFKVVTDKPKSKSSKYKLCKFAKKKLINLRFCTLGNLKNLLSIILRIMTKRWLKKLTLEEIQQQFGSLYWE